jgi:hypothetical protein
MKMANMDQTPIADPLSTLTSQAFVEQVQTKFRTGFSETETGELELVEIVDHPTVPGMECFSLLFRGPVSPVLGQGMRRMEHPHLGAMELFITPVALDKQGATYEVVFNRTKPKS